MAASITWLGHATFELVLPDERCILIDPWIEANPACPKTLKTPSRCDMILLTHGHADHVGDVAQLVRAFDPPVIGNVELCAALERQIGKGRFHGMNTGGTQTVDRVHVSLTRAYHSSSVDGSNGPIYAGMPNGLVVAVHGLATLYHAGDTDVFSDMKLIAELFEPKVCCLPIGDHYTMGARGAALAAEMLNPVAIIPMHYKTFPMLAQSADAFRDALSAELRDRLVVPNVGQSMAWSDRGAGL